MFQLNYRIFPLIKKKLCTSLHVPSRKRQIKVRLADHSRIVSLQYGICFMPQLLAPRIWRWRQHFWKIFCTSSSFFFRDRRGRFLANRYVYGPHRDRDAMILTLFTLGFTAYCYLYSLPIRMEPKYCSRYAEQAWA
jgi:hypothetical protein